VHLALHARGGAALTVGRLRPDFCHQSLQADRVVQTRLIGKQHPIAVVVGHVMSAGDCVVRGRGSVVSYEVTVVSCEAAVVSCEASVVSCEAAVVL